MKNSKINKDLVTHRFERANQSYAKHAVIQQKVATELLQLLHQCQPNTHFENVFEIGCGSGHLSTLFIEQFKYQHLYLNDLYHGVQQYFQNTDQIQWCIGDIEAIAFPNNLDLILSSSALQWVKDLDAIIAKSSQSLKAKGLICFSTYGKKNLKEMKALTSHGLDYLSLEQIRIKLLNNGFEILHLTEQYEALKFEHPKQVLQHLQATGVTATSSAQFRWTKKSLEEFYLDYRRFIDTDEHENLVYPLSYHPIYVVARRSA